MEALVDPQIIIAVLGIVAGTVVAPIVAKRLGRRERHSRIRATEIEGLSKIIERAYAEIDRARIEIDRLEEENADLHLQLDRLRAELTLVRDELDRLRKALRWEPPGRQIMGDNGSTTRGQD